MSAKRLGVLAAVVIAVLAALAAVGFEAYALGKNAGRAEALTASGASAADSLPGRSDGAGAASGQAIAASVGRPHPNGDRNEPAGNFAGGEVQSVSGDIIELSTATEVLKVKVDSQTQIQKTLSGSMSDLQPGEWVVIQGERAADGTLVARSIQVGSGGFFGGWGAGGQPSTTPPASK